jgi:hypothetical protein
MSHATSAALLFSVSALAWGATSAQSETTGGSLRMVEAGPQLAQVMLTRSTDPVVLQGSG